MRFRVELFREKGIKGSIQVSGLGLREERLRQGIGFKVSGSGFRLEGLGFVGSQVCDFEGVRNMYIRMLKDGHTGYKSSALNPNFGRRTVHTFPKPHRHREFLKP